jgi:hypothetical protein
MGSFATDALIEQRLESNGWTGFDIQPDMATLGFDAPRIANGETLEGNEPTIVGARTIQKRVPSNRLMRTLTRRLRAACRAYRLQWRRHRRLTCDSNDRNIPGGGRWRSPEHVA